MTQTAATTVRNLDWPLMQNNITRDDLDAVVRFLSDGEPILTQSRQVQAFEREWSEWVGTKHSVFVNSGSSANLITLAALRETAGAGRGHRAAADLGLGHCRRAPERLHAGVRRHRPPHAGHAAGPGPGEDHGPHQGRFHHAHPGLQRAHAGLGRRTGSARKIPLIEDVCESHGATMQGRKLGSFGLMSNFSFYYAHHLSTIEGGMVCTDDRRLYEMLRMLRSHGMVRECSGPEFKTPYYRAAPRPQPRLHLRLSRLQRPLDGDQRRLRPVAAQAAGRQQSAAPAEPRPVPGQPRRQQVPDRLCHGRKLQLRLHAGPAAARRRLARSGHADAAGRIGWSSAAAPPAAATSFASPTCGGCWATRSACSYPNVDHVHFYGFYIGNYPDLPQEKIPVLCEILNRL